MVSRGLTATICCPFSAVQHSRGCQPVACLALNGESPATRAMQTIDPQTKLGTPRLACERAQVPAVSDWEVQIPDMAPPGSMSDRSSGYRRKEEKIRRWLRPERLTSRSEARTSDRVGGERGQSEPAVVEEDFPMEKPGGQGCRRPWRASREHEVLAPGQPVRW